MKETGSKRPTDLSGARHTRQGMPSHRAGWRAQTARSWRTSGWLLLCLALLMVYLVAVFVIANLLRAISF